jgi:hypothetical protein
VQWYLNKPSIKILSSWDNPVCESLFFRKRTVAIFVVIWQNLSNYGLTRLKRFVSTFTYKLCNYLSFLPTFNTHVFKDSMWWVKEKIFWFAWEGNTPLPYTPCPGDDWRACPYALIDKSEVPVSRAEQANRDNHISVKPIPESPRSSTSSLQLALQGKTESDGSPITLIRSPARMWPLPHPIRVPAARGRCRHRIADADVPRVPLRGSCSSRCYSTFFVSGQWSVSDPVRISTTLPPELGGQPRCLSAWWWRRAVFSF